MLYIYNTQTMIKSLSLNFFSIIIFALFLNSCGTTTYLGDQLTATSNVDVYYAEKDVKREYKVIGHITAQTGGNDNDAKPDIIKRAKKAGADGVVILGTSYTGGKDSEPLVKAEAIKYIN